MNTTHAHTGPGEPRYLAARVEALEAVLRDRERELLELKGRCSTCRLHYAHSGPCDIKPASSDDTEPAAQHVHTWRWHQNVTSKGYAMTPIEVCECGAARPLTEPAQPGAEPGWSYPPPSAASMSTAQPAAEPGVVEPAVELLAGIRCQLLHEQIACAYCANCLSWARHVALPQWGPGLARHDAEVAARALRDTARSIEGMATASQYGPHRRAGMRDAAARCERLAEYAEGTR